MNKIDLSPIVGSQILCEFLNGDFKDAGDVFDIGFLDEIEEENGELIYYSPQHLYGWTNCRIYQHPDYWISNLDGKLVLPDGLKVRVAHFNKLIEQNLVTRDNRLFSTCGMEYCIVVSEAAYVQVTGTADGWEY